MAAIRESSSDRANDEKICRQGAQGEGRIGPIEQCLLNNRQTKRKGFIAFLNAGDPDLGTTQDIIVALERCDVDVIELGVPFPDSCTDGDTILRSHKRALQKGVNLEAVLEMVSELRKRSRIPLVLMADYGSTVKARGIDAFLRQSKQNGIDGVLLHCLPPFLTTHYRDASEQYGLETIFSLYPQTEEAKRKSIYAAANGFLYLVSKYGKTGSGGVFTEQVLAYFEKVRRETALPLVVGFGVNSADDVRTIFNTGVDGVVIGSGLVEVIETQRNDKAKMLSEIRALFRRLKNVPGA